MILDLTTKYAANFFKEPQACKIVWNLDVTVSSLECNCEIVHHYTNAAKTFDVQATN